MGRRERILLTLALVTLSASAGASKWVAVKPGDNRVLLDVQSVRREGFHVTMWIKSTADSPVPGAATTLAQWAFDCEAKKMTVESATYYRADGTYLNSVEMPESDRAWVAVPPDTIADQIADTVCPK